MKTDRILGIMASVFMVIITAFSFQGAEAQQQFQPASGQPVSLCAIISTSSLSFSVGQSASITVTPSGGLPPYHIGIGYSDEPNSHADSFDTSSSVTDIVTPVKGYPFNVSISDSYGNSIDMQPILNGNIPVENLGFNPVQLSSGQPVNFCATVSPSSTTAAVGQSVPITVTLSGLLPPYNIKINDAYDGIMLGVSNSSSSFTSQFSSTISTIHNLMINFGSHGSGGFMGSSITVGSASSTTSGNYVGGLTLVSQAQKQGYQVSVSPTTSTTSTGQNVQFVVTPKGGMQPYTYLVYDNGQYLPYSWKVQSNPYLFTYLPTSVGSHELKFFVDDSVAAQNTAYAEAYVNSQQPPISNNLSPPNIPQSFNIVNAGFLLGGLVVPVIILGFIIVIVIVIVKGKSKGFASSSNATSSGSHDGSTYSDGPNPPPRIENNSIWAWTREDQEKYDRERRDWEDRFTPK